MKYPKLAVFAAACIIASCQPVAAANEACMLQVELAETVMKARQGGVTVATALSINKQQDPYIRKISDALVNWAYTKPRFSTKSYQLDAINDFTTAVYNNCKDAK